MTDSKPGHQRATQRDADRADATQVRQGKLPRPRTEAHRRADPLRLGDAAHALYKQERGTFFFSFLSFPFSSIFLSTRLLAVFSASILPFIYPSTAHLALLVETTYPPQRSPRSIPRHLSPLSRPLIPCPPRLNFYSPIHPLLSHNLPSTSSCPPLLLTFHSGPSPPPYKPHFTPHHRRLLLSCSKIEQRSNRKQSIPATRLHFTRILCGYDEEPHQKLRSR